MNETCDLSKKTCLPCRGDVPPLTAEHSKILLNKICNWTINHHGHLYKEYSFADFMEAINFANDIAVIAEKEAHHPDLTLSWGKCYIEIWTHKISGLTESDFILASKIDQLKS